MKKLFLGIFIGIGLIMPGVSCASMAVILNVYDEFLDVTSGFYRPRVVIKNFLFILGIIIGVVVVMLCIMTYYQLFRFAIEGLFMSLVLFGTIKYQKRIENPSLRNPLSFVLLGILAMLFIKLLMESSNFSEQPTLWKIASIGFISSIAFVIPGISGGLILLSFGIYFKLLNDLKKIANVFPHIFQARESMVVVCIFCLSLVVGTIFFSTIFKKLIKNRSDNFSNFILGIMYGSIFLMFVESSDFLNSRLFFIEYLLGMIIGNLLSRLLLSFKK